MKFTHSFEIDKFPYFESLVMKVTYLENTHYDQHDCSKC